jgi:hypothetical protein
MEVKQEALGRLEGEINLFQSENAGIDVSAAGPFRRRVDAISWSGQVGDSRDC